MKSIKILLAIALVAGAGNAAIGQQGTWKLNLNYGVGLPGSNMKTMFNDPSYRGWSGAVLYGASDKLQVGLEAGFQDFYQKNNRALYAEGGSDISAVVTHSVQTIPIMAKAKYMFTDAGTVRPFAGLGIGGNLIQYRKFYGQFSDNDTKFGFAAQPELGVHVPLGRYGNTGIHVAAGYNIMPYQYGDADGLGGAIIKAGISVPLR